MVEFINTEEELSFHEVTVELKRRAEAIRSNREDEMIWFVKHPPMYTGGLESLDENLINPGNVPVYKTFRGGDYGWHGPGSLNAYMMFDLKKRQGDLKKFFDSIHSWIIESLAEFNINGRTAEGTTGVFVDRDHGTDKIAAIAFGIKNHITHYGFTLNVNPDMEVFERIVLCGLKQTGVTSMKELGADATLEEVQEVLKKNFSKHFK